MARGPYLHTDGPGRGITWDGVPEGSPTKVWACESRELGLRALNALKAENTGDLIDRFLVVTRKTEA